MCLIYWFMDDKITRKKLEKYFSITSAGILVEDEKGVFTGIQSFIKIFPKIKFRGETKDREKLIRVLQEAYKDNTLFIRKLPVIPPDFRPAQEIDGRQELDALNDIYLSILRRTTQIRSLKPHFFK